MKKVLVPLAVILAAVVLVGIMNAFKREPETKEIAETVTIVETVPLKKEDIRFTIASQGNVAPRTETTLISEISGTVVSTSAKFVAGGFFKKGEVLLTLNPTDYEVALQQARANLLGKQAQLTREEAQAEQAKKEWALTKRPLNEAPILALRTPFLAEAKANVLSAEAELIRAEHKLEQTVFAAPYDGMIKAKNVDVGQYISVGTQVATAFAVDIAEIRLPLTDRDIAFLDLPAPAQALSGKAIDVALTSTIGNKHFQWQGKIVRTEGVVDQQTRVHYAVAQIIDPYNLNATHNSSGEGDASNPALPMGSFVRAEVQGRLMQDMVAIPLQALRGMNQILLKDADNHLRIRNVDIVHTDDKNAYVQSQDLDQQLAITTAVYNPVEGMVLQNGVKEDVAAK
jgi:RND family efflux transporter MFP subunit